MNGNGRLDSLLRNTSQKALTTLVGVVALCYQHYAAIGADNKVPQLSQA